jgi:hypothetical protein
MLTFVEKLKNSMHGGANFATIVYNGKDGIHTYNICINCNIPSKGGETWGIWKKSGVGYLGDKTYLRGIVLSKDGKKVVAPKDGRIRCFIVGNIGNCKIGGEIF